MSEVVISIEGLEKSYGTHKVLKGIDMHIQKGDIYGLIGKNGAGKTTLFKTILGLSEFEKGTLSIFGAKGRKGNAAARNRIGFLVGISQYAYLSGRANLEYFRRIKGITDKNEVDRVLEVVGLDERAAKTAAGRYSLGMKQRLGIANALLGNPELLIFDEPTNGLDPQGIMDIRNLMQKINEEYGTTIIVSSHILGELQHTAHKFGILHEGVMMKELVQEDFRVQKDITSINVSDNDVEKAVALLEQNGITVHGTAQAESSLEDYYFDLIGGGEDA